MTKRRPTLCRTGTRAMKRSARRLAPTLGVVLPMLRADPFAVEIATTAARPPRVPEGSFALLSRFVSVSGSGTGGRHHYRTARAQSGRGGLLGLLRLASISGAGRRLRLGSRTRCQIVPKRTTVAL